MPQLQDVIDVVALMVPEQVQPRLDPTNPDPAIIKSLDAMAQNSVIGQFKDRERPLALIGLRTEWHFATDAEQVELFQPAHDCAACLAGNDQARAFLAANPGRMVALGNIFYSTLWKL